jgi:hypothetical protein
LTEKRLATVMEIESETLPQPEVITHGYSQGKFGMRAEYSM